MDGVDDRASERNSIFSTWQPIYAERGIATFPVGENKKPSVRGWIQAGQGRSAAWAAKFKQARAFGYVTGRRSNVTVVDVDTADENVAGDAIRQHGQPAIITRTASGKFHHLYRYSGERRRIRPWPGRPIDILGDNGFALAAPSELATGSYEIIHGHLDDLDRLTPMVGAPSEAISRPLPSKWSGMREGDGRNRALWERCMRTGAGRSFDGMLEIARTANQEFKEPMMETEVVKIAKSAWEHDAMGLNFFLRPRIMLDHDIFDQLAAKEPDAILLWVRLERFHGGNDSFALANAMAGSMGWGLPRWQRARDLLSRIGVIRRLKRGGNGPNDPPVYGWALKG